MLNNNIYKDIVNTNKMDVYEKLQEIGLTGNESKVYLELIKKGELTANQISKNIGMDRTLSYTVLNHLIEKGQVNYVIKGTTKVFSCSNPESLLNPIKAKEILAFDLIKEIKKFEKGKQKTTEVNVYEGKQGMRALIGIMLKSKSYCAFGSTGRAYDLLYEMDAVAKKLIKEGRSVRIITSSKFKEHEMTKFSGIKFRYAEVKSEATTSISGDYVSIHLIKDKPIAILIKDKDIAESYRNYFEFMWRNAKKS